MDKIFFIPGDVVTLKQEIENVPKMIVVRKEAVIFKNQKDGSSPLIGIRCRWFDSNSGVQEAVFNTKDLIKVE